MAKVKFFRILGITLLFSLLFTLIPAAAVVAINDILVSASTGSIGDSITITGSGWTASDSERHASIVFAKDEANIGQLISTSVDTYQIVGSGIIGFLNEDDEGEFTATVTIPANLTDGTDDMAIVPGTYYIYVTVLTTSGGGDYIYAKYPFTVIGGEITLSPSQGIVDSTLIISGSNFVANTALTIKFDGITTTVLSGTSTQTSSTGTFTSNIAVPEGIAGAHSVSVTVGSTTRTATFSILPDILITPQSGEPGDTVLVSGTGFGRRVVPTMYFNFLPVETVSPVLTDTIGTFTASFLVPSNLGTGIYQVEADDGTNVASASFTLNISTTPTETTTTTTSTTTTTTTTTSPVNTAIIDVNVDSGYFSVGGSGFTPSTQVNVLIDGEEFHTVMSDANGNIIISPMELPELTGGQHVITVTDGTNSDTHTYNVESDPPPVPQPLAPGTGAEVKGQVEFEWEPVSDISQPVTYQLQIANSQSFSAGSIILDIDDIPAGYYQLTELEVGELVGVETPYYYRIRAIDAASNAGSWTPVVDFYVKESTGFPNWAIYTLAGVGGVLLFGIGYLVGRRTAFYY